MKDSDKDFPNKTPGNNSPRKDAELDELRRLLLGQEQTQIVQLKERLDNPSLLVKDVERVLPEAIKLRTSRDKDIAKALEPNIEEGLRASIKKDPKALADTLYPIMGPSIRKAISSAILGMIQSINHIVEHTFSVQGLKWRLEALTTKKPFAEVVLLNTLIYQVEQVFLIHRNTGLVLQHVVAKEVTTHAPDLISSMLTAIQDFVQDSFGVEKGESLDTLRMEGDRSVWIEQGPQAILAAVIRGTPPLDVRSVFREVLDEIHIQQSDALTRVGKTPRERGPPEDHGQCKEPSQRQQSTLLYTVYQPIYQGMTTVEVRIRAYPKSPDFDTLRTQSTDFSDRL